MGLPCKFHACRAGPLLKGLQICCKRADQNLVPFLPPGLRWGNLIKIFSLFNTQPNRPWASHASFKHVRQTLYSRGFKFVENGPIKILVHFCLQVHSVGILSKFVVFSSHNLKGLWPPLQVSSMYCRTSTQGASYLLKMAQSKVWSIFASRSTVNLIKIFILYNAQTNRRRSSPAIFQHVGQTPYSRGFKYDENRPIKNLVHFGLQDRGGRT